MRDFPKHLIPFRMLYRTILRASANANNILIGIHEFQKFRDMSIATDRGKRPTTVLYCVIAGGLYY